jgi:hypothetical protein
VGSRTIAPGRLGGGLTRGVDGQHAADANLALSDLHARDEQLVAGGLGGHVVADGDGRHDEAELLGHLLAHASDASEQLAVAVHVGERKELEPELHRHEVDRKHLGDLLLLRLGVGDALAVELGLLLGIDDARALLARLALRLLLADIADACDDTGHREERKVGHARNDPEHAEDGSGGPSGLGAIEELAAERAHHAAGLGAVARDEQRGARGHQERRKLRDEAVADREDAVGLRRLEQRQVVLHHADDDPGDHVDRHDDQARDRITADELGRTIHGPVELRVRLNLFTTLPGGLLVDETRNQVGVDGHLLARHRVQREASADLGDPVGTFGDHDEVDEHEDEEHHRADDEVSADHELAERRDDLPSRVHAFSPVKEDVAGRGHVEAEPEQRDEDEQRGERGEVEGLLHVHRDQEDEQRHAQASRHQEVEQHRRKRKHRERQHAHHENRTRRVPQVLCACAGLLFRH